jgi:protein-S-isoprenylcysteine O-methyltransferase Ste14
VVVWAMSELRQLAKRRPEATKVDWKDETVLRVSVLAGVVLAVLALHAVPAASIHPALLAAWLGLIFLWCGEALRIWCFHTLGRYFTLTVRASRDQPVIADGPYRVLRHPSYAGSLLVVAGIGWLFGNWLSLLAIVVGMTVGLVYRIRAEEGALLLNLGDRYRDYAATRKRLVPYVW